ncbi:MAG: zinc-binding dehydrogenase [Proteobacteria bacterium]|nr:zinc-binding dehydrogenase [Pseudomonadota bacterium]
MKAAIFHEPLKMTTEEVEKPTAENGQILVKVKACGICGSDLHAYKLDLKTELLVRETDKGGVMGHEFSGDVVEVGAGVEGIEVGDRVAAVSNGGFAEYVPVPCFTGFNVHKLPPEVSYEEAATLEPLANSLHATLKGNPQNGENVVVFGMGIIGLGIVQCLRALEIDLNQLIVVDVSDHRLELAKKLGADATINASKVDVLKKVEELVGGGSLMLYPNEHTLNVDVSYDCVGYIKERSEPPSIQLAIDMAREFTGRIVVHGLFEANVSLDLMPLVSKHTDILGSFAFSAEEAARALEMIREKKVDRKILISHEFPLDKAKEAFDTQCQVGESIKVLVKPE